MTAEVNYAKWRRSWPDVIARTQTDTAVDHLQRYYAVFDGDQPQYTGSQFESVATLNTDANTLGTADFVAVSMLSDNTVRLWDSESGLILRGIRVGQSHTQREERGDGGECRGHQGPHQTVPFVNPS
jgi:hypothetical protein